MKYTISLIAILALMGCAKEWNNAPTEATVTTVSATNPITVTCVDYIPPVSGTSVGKIKWEIKNVSTKSLDSVYYVIQAPPTGATISTVQVGTMQPTDAYIATVDENRSIVCHWKGE
jgi:hypothetical protein